MNPPVGKLLIGVFTAGALQPGDVVDYRWEWGQTLEWNARAGRLPPQHVLLAVRRGTAVIGTLCLLLSYLIAAQLVGLRWTALWAPLALFGNPVFRAHSAIAYTNVPQLFFLLLSIWLFNGFLYRRAWSSLICSTISMGLACAVKFSAAPVIVAALLVAVYILPDARRRLTAAFCIIAVPYLIFVVVNPYLYADPLFRTVAIVREWSRYTRMQQADPLQVGVVRNSATGAALVLTRSIVSQEHASPNRQTPAGELSLVESLAAALVGLALAMRMWRAPREVRWRQLLSWLGLLVVCGTVYRTQYDDWGGAGFMLLVAGFVSVRRSAFGAARSSGAGEVDVRAAFVAVALIVFSAWTALWLPFDWARYFLPIAVWIPIMQVLGLVQIADAHLHPWVPANVSGVGDCANPTVRRGTGSATW